VIATQVSKQRLALAFLLSPLAVPLVFCLLPLIPLLIFDPPAVKNASVASVTAWLLIFSAYALPVACLAELILGVPAWMLLRRCRVTHLGIFALCGAFLGWLVAVLLVILTGGSVAKTLNPL